MKRAAYIAGIAVAVLVGWVCVETALVLREVRVTTVETRQRIEDTSSNLNGVLIQAGLVLDQVRQTAETQQSTAQEAVQNSARATKAAADTLERVNGLVERMDKELVPEATKTLSTASQNMTNLSVEAIMTLRETQKQLEPSLVNLAEASKGAADRMNDPNIAKSVANVERLTQDAADSMAHVEETAKTVEETTKRLTKPGSLFLRGLKLAADWTWKALTSLKGF